MMEKTKKTPTRQTNCTAATDVLPPVSCNKQIHHTDPLPPIIMENKNESN